MDMMCHDIYSIGRLWDQKKKNSTWFQSYFVFSENCWPWDILAAADHLIGMKSRMVTLDDMNHLKNKCIQFVADLLEDQFGVALFHLENMIRWTISGVIRHKLIPTPHNLVTSTPLTITYESFFSDYTPYLMFWIELIY